MKKFFIVFAVLAVTIAASLAFAGPPSAPLDTSQAFMKKVIAHTDISIIATATTPRVLARTDYPVLNKNADTTLMILVGKKTAPAATYRAGFIMAAESHNNLLTGIAAKTVPKAFAQSNIKKASAWAVVLSDRSAAFA